MSGRSLGRRLVNVVGFLLTLSVCSYSLETPFHPTYSPLVAVACAVGALPVVIVGRMVLDLHPSAERAGWVTALVHYDMMVLLGPATLEAVQTTIANPLWTLPIPAEPGIALMLVGQVGVLVAMLNLALSGMGAPFAIALSRRLAARGLYAWTRNPMILSVLVCLVGVGLWLRSGLFLLWVLAVFTPVILIFLVAYEERELELRFGDAYLNYKATTPMLWPRRPRPIADRLIALSRAARKGR